MNTIDLRSSSDLNFSNFPVRTGKIQFFYKQVYVAGRDARDYFGETIKLQNGNPLHVSIDDKIFQFLLITPENKNPLEMELPSSIFTQARKANKIFFSHKDNFSHKEYNYELELSPCFSGWNNHVETYSFDQCLKGLGDQDGTNSAKFRLNEFPTVSIYWGENIELSSKAKRIELGKPGCIPINSNDLRFIGNNVIVCEGSVCKLNDRFYTLLLDIPGSLEDNVEDQCDRIFIEIIIDNDVLYVHSYPKSNQTYHVEKLFIFPLYTILECIEKEAILVMRRNDGMLEIQLPLETESANDKVEEAPVETNSIENDQTESESANDKVEEAPVETNFTASVNNIETDKLDNEPSNNKYNAKCILQ